MGAITLFFRAGFGPLPRSLRGRLHGERHRRKNPMTNDNGAAELRVYAFKDHAGHWPVPTASIVVAPDLATAADLLSVALASRGLVHTSEQGEVMELDLTRPGVVVLSDGQY